MKQVCFKNSKNYCHPTTHNHIHSTEKSVLKNKTCISLWPFSSGKCLTMQAKCLIALHLPLSYFPPHLFVFHHSLLNCPLANCRLFKMNLCQVILRFAAVYSVVRHELAKISSTILFQSGRNFNHWTDVSFWRETQLPWYLFIHQRLSNLHFFIAQYKRYILNDSNMNQFHCEQNVTDEYNFTSFFPLMKK